MNGIKLVLVHDATGDRITVDEIYRSYVFVKHLEGLILREVSWWENHGWRIVELERCTKPAGEPMEERGLGW